jgi:hypothetical protein
VLITLSLAAFTAALSGLPVFVLRQFPGFWLAKPVLFAAYPMSPTLAWVLLAGTAFAFAIREAGPHAGDRNDRKDRHVLVVFGIGLSFVALGSLVWRVVAVFGPGFPDAVRSILVCFLLGFAVIAAQTLALAVGATPRNEAPSAPSTLLFLAGLGFAIGVLSCLVALGSWLPQFIPTEVGMGVSIGLVGIAFLTAAGLRLASVPIMAGAGLGLILVAIGTAALGIARVMSPHASQVVTCTGFLVLALIGAYAAAKCHSSVPTTSDQSTVAPPKLPAPRRRRPKAHDV